MPEIVTSSSPVPNLQHISAHIAHTVVDNSGVPAPTIMAATGHLFVVAYTERGITDRLMTFNASNNGYSRMLTMFGDPNMRKLGLTYSGAVKHLQEGGDVSIISVKDEAAKNACFIISLQIVTEDSSSNPLKKTIGYTLKDGTGFTTLTENPDPLLYDPVEMETFQLAYVVETVTGVTSMDELEIIVNSKLTTAKADKKYPLIYGMYNGKGSYGNNFQVDFQQVALTISGRPYFETRIMDTRNNFNILERQFTSINNDKLDGSLPLLIDYPFNSEFQSQSDRSFNLKCINDIYMNEIGQLIYDELDSLAPFSNPTTAGPEAVAFMNRVTTLKNKYTPDDQDLWHQMRYFNVCNTKDFDEFTLDSETIPSTRFVGGDNGYLADMKYWDWNFEASVPDGSGGTVTKKVIPPMFVDAFMGVSDPNIYDYLENECDYVIDFGYPDDVKAAINSFGVQRSEVQLLFNAPITVDRNGAAINWKIQNNYESRNITYWGANFETEDSVTSRYVRVPSTYLVMSNVLRLYMGGYNASLAYIDYGVISGANPGSGRAAIGRLYETDQLLEAGINHFQSQSGGYKIDSQKSNYKLSEVSMLQEFHNNIILNRALKILYKSLLNEKHSLANENTILRIDAKIKQDLAEIMTKVNYLNVDVGYESAYDQTLGLLRIGLNIGFFGTNKYFFIVATADPIG